MLSASTRSTRGSSAAAACTTARLPVASARLNRTYGDPLIDTNTCSHPDGMAVESGGRWRSGLAPPETPDEQQHDHHADDRARQPAEIEDLGVADPEQLGEDEVADHRAGEPDGERAEASERILPGQQQPPDVAGEDPEHDGADHASALPTNRHLQPRIDRFALQREHGEDALVHAVEGLAAHEALERLDP